MASAPTVRVGVSGFVLASRNEDSQNPRFLIGKRLNSHGAGTYALPGGHLEFGEEPEDCVARELREETGLKVTHVRFLTATNDYMPEDRKHYVTMFMVCERENDADEAQVLEPEKCEGWEWVRWRDLTAWIHQELTAAGRDGECDAVLERRLFLPLLNLVRQRPGVLPTNV